MMRNWHYGLLLVACLLAVGWAIPDNAWSWGGEPLVVIDGQEYSANDYQQWWEHWRDTDSQVPEGVQPFVDWLLMVREAERMDLASLPEYKHKIDVFLEARSLMALKHEVIDSRISIDDRVVQDSYDRYYVPRRLIGVLEFSSMAAASSFMDKFSGQIMSPENLRSMGEKHPDPPFVFQQPQWLRPISTPASWMPLLNESRPGIFRGPLPNGEKAEVICVFEEQPADKDDYAKKKEMIARKLHKQQEQVLTEQFVWQLRDKYHVRLDDKVLESINLDDPGANDLEQVVIDSDRSKVTVGYFLDQSRRAEQLARQRPANEKDKILMKQKLANTMIANSLVSWEALARHYEEKEPLRAMYQFYRQNRLAVELVNRAPGDVQVDESEVKSYYQDHLNEYKHPELIRMVMAVGSEPAVKKVWAEAIAGSDLIKAAGKAGATVTVPADQMVPIQHFSRETQEVVASLKPGDLAQPFLDNGQAVVIKLIERTPESVAPFEQASKDIRDKLVAEKRQIRKKNLIETLRSRSHIVVNDEMWSKIAAQYH